jgi:molecular chaperone DnaK
MSGATIGIDLGTTNSVVAVIQDGKPVVVHNREGAHTTPSMVAISSTGDMLVGTLAKRQAIANAKNTIYSVKRLIGRRFLASDVQRFRHVASFPIVESPNGDAWVELSGSQHSPPAISAHVLEAMKQIAEDFIGEPVTDAVITVPAHFTESQRQATKDAGSIARLNVRRIINEPTAAALAYGVQKDKDQTLAVFDLGGGTFDISILEMIGGAFEVLATAGDSHLGGDDFDLRLVDYLVERAERESGAAIRQDATALRRLKEVAELAKMELSHAAATAISVPFLAQVQGKPAHLEIERLERETLERLVEPELHRLRAPCMRALHDAGLEPGDIDRVLLVGGMSRMPAVQRVVEEIFHQKPKKDVNPDLVVAMGAAVQGAILSGARDDAVLMDVTSHSLGIRVVDGRLSRVIDRNTRIPCRHTKLFAPAEKGQDFVKLRVYQGEAELADDAEHLGEVTLSAIPATVDGREPRIEVTFHVDADGLLSVTAMEPSTGGAASVSIRPSGGLAKEEIDALRKARKDKKDGGAVRPPE